MKTRWGKYVIDFVVQGIQIWKREPKICCISLELEVDETREIVTSLKEAKQRFRQLAIRHLFKQGDRIPAKERFTVTMSADKANKYHAYVESICLDEIDEWRQEIAPGWKPK